MDYVDLIDYGKKKTKKAVDISSRCVVWAEQVGGGGLSDVPMY